MPELRLLPLEEALGAAQLKKLQVQLSELGFDELPDPSLDLEHEDMLSAEQLSDFMDRLEAHDIACSLYLPVEFEGVFAVGGTSVGSLFTLTEALEELRGELDIEEEEEEEQADDEDGNGENMIEDQLVDAWRAFHKAAALGVERGLPLHVIA